jgi:hypothetical protein
MDCPQEVRRGFRSAKLVRSVMLLLSSLNNRAHDCIEHDASTKLKPSGPP